MRDSAAIYGVWEDAESDRVGMRAPEVASLLIVRPTATKHARAFVYLDARNRPQINGLQTTMRNSTGRAVITAMRTCAASAWS